MTLLLSKWGSPFQQPTTQHSQHWHSEHGLWGWPHALSSPLWTNSSATEPTLSTSPPSQHRFSLSQLGNSWQQHFPPNQFVSRWPNGLSPWTLAPSIWRNMHSSPSLPALDPVVFMPSTLSLLLRLSTTGISIHLPLFSWHFPPRSTLITIHYSSHCFFSINIFCWK